MPVYVVLLGNKDMLRQVAHGFKSAIAVCSDTYSERRVTVRA
jgi:hypothetical protein